LQSFSSSHDMVKLSKTHKKGILLYLLLRKRRQARAMRRVRTLYMRPLNLNRDSIAYDRLHLVVDTVGFYSNLQ